MTSLYALILGIVWIVLVYKFYAKRVDQRIIVADGKKATPAVMYMDGVEFMPANKNVLFGFQYKTICGIGPVAGAIFDFSSSITRAKSLLCTVNEKSVLPSRDTFWMMTSTSMLASATAPRI